MSLSERWLAYMTKFYQTIPIHKYLIELLANNFSISGQQRKASL